MDFIGQYSIDESICDRLIELHRYCDRKGLAQRGRVNVNGAPGVDLHSKDSFDIRVGDIPLVLHEKYGVDLYVKELQRCAQLYLDEYPGLRKVAPFRVTESPGIQHYRPGGGFKSEHF